MDKLHMALTELWYAINYCPTITVWDYAFAPREYLYQHLESRFARVVVGMVMYNSETGDIAKPTELLASVKAYMNVLQTVENYGKDYCFTWSLIVGWLKRLFITSSYRCDSSFQQRFASTDSIRGQQWRENHRFSLRYLVSFLFRCSLMYSNNHILW